MSPLAVMWKNVKVIETKTGKFDDTRVSCGAVSYTHLDVYKRQVKTLPKHCILE